MGLLDKLWDDVLAGPQPDQGLKKLRKERLAGHGLSDAFQDGMLCFCLHHLVPSCMRTVSCFLGVRFVHSIELWCWMRRYEIDL
jgi:hypothetical protein